MAVIVNGHKYEDEGCEIAPRCLECPLGVCRFELEPVIPARIIIKDLVILGMFRDSPTMTDLEAAAACGTTPRTVRRVLIRGKEVYKL